MRNHTHNPETHDHPFMRRSGGPRGFGPGPGGHPGFGGFGPRGFMPPGPQRKRRGDVRHAIISLLAEGPSNGYGLIKAIATKSGGTWTPSPGSVYPTLQQLVDEELIETVGEGRRTDFQLTAAGTAYAKEHADELERLWNATEQDASAEAALGESIQKFMGVVHQFRFAATDDQRAKAVDAIDQARRTLYGILAD
jgi:DNA-binding PadR family transcriptional regulator